MANVPTPDKSLGKSSDKPSDISQAASSGVTFIVRTALLGVSAIAGIGIGLAIALVRPDIVWQPSSNNFFIKSNSLLFLPMPYLKSIEPVFALKVFVC